MLRDEARERKQCQRGNAVRAFERWRVRRDVVAGTLPRLVLTQTRARFPILDCSATVELGRNVPLALASQLAVERAALTPSP